MNLRIAEVGLKVDDLQRSVSFYEKMLGFTAVYAEEQAIFLKVGDLDSPLGEVGHPQFLALFKRDTILEYGRTTLDHLAFEVPNADYARLLAHFKAKEMVIRERAYPDSLPWPARSFFFRDPDGNVIELITANGE